MLGIFPAHQSAHTQKKAGTCPERWPTPAGHTAGFGAGIGVEDHLRSDFGNQEAFPVFAKLPT